MNDIEIALEDLDTLVEIARQHMTIGGWLGITRSALTIKKVLEKQLAEQVADEITKDIIGVRK